MKMSNRNKFIILTIAISLTFGSVTHAQLIKPEEKQAISNFWNSLNKPLFEVEEKEIQKIEVPKIEIKLNSKVFDKLASLVKRIQHVKMPDIELPTIEITKKDRTNTFIGLEDKIKNTGFASLLNNIKEEYLGFEPTKPRDIERNVVEIAHISNQFKKVRNFLSFTYNKVANIELPDVERPEKQRKDSFLGPEKVTGLNWASLWQNIDARLINIEVNEPENIGIKPIRIGKISLSSIYNHLRNVKLSSIQRPETQRSDNFLGLGRATEFDWASLWKNIDAKLIDTNVEVPERIKLKPVKIGKVNLSIFNEIADHIYFGLNSIRNLRSDRNSAEARFLEPFIDRNQRTLGNLLGILKDKIISFEWEADITETRDKPTVAERSSAFIDNFIKQWVSIPEEKVQEPTPTPELTPEPENINSQDDNNGV